MTNFFDLPLEVQLQVFRSFNCLELLSLQLVSHSFSYLCLHPFSWQRVVFLTLKTEGILKILQKQGSFICHLYIHGVDEDLCMADLARILLLVPKIQSFYWKQPMPTPPAFLMQSVPPAIEHNSAVWDSQEWKCSKWPLLKSLTLSHFIADENTALSVGMEMILEQVLNAAPSLKLFSLTHLSYLKSLPAKPVNLNLTRLQLIKVSQVPRGVLQSFIFRCSSSLVSLILRECPQLEDQTLINVIIPNCKKLQFLDLSGSVRITDAAVAQLIGLPLLRGIYLKGCRRVEEKTVDGLVKAGLLLERAQTPLGKWRFWRSFNVGFTDFNLLA